jgi:hypothetical protein
VRLNHAQRYDPELFGQFLRYVERKIDGLSSIETTYLTRAWSARRI